MSDDTVWGAVILAPIVALYVWELLQDKRRGGRR